MKLNEYPLYFGALQNYLESQMVSPTIDIIDPVWITAAISGGFGFDPTAPAPIIKVPEFVVPDPSLPGLDLCIQAASQIDPAIWFQHSNDPYNSGIRNEDVFIQSLMAILGLANLKYGTKTEAGPHFTGDIPTIDGSATFRGMSYWLSYILPADAKTLYTISTSGGELGILPSTDPGPPSVTGSGAVMYNYTRTFTLSPAGSGLLAVLRNIPVAQFSLYQLGLGQVMAAGSLMMSLYLAYGNPKFIKPIKGAPKISEVVKWNPKFDIVAVCKELGRSYEGVTDSITPDIIPSLPV